VDLDYFDFFRSKSLDSLVRMFPFVATSLYVGGLILLNAYYYYGWRFVDLGLSNTVCVAAALIAVLVLPLTLILGRLGNYLTDWVLDGGTWRRWLVFGLALILVFLNWITGRLNAQVQSCLSHNPPKISRQVVPYLIAIAVYLCMAYLLLVVGLVWNIPRSREIVGASAGRNVRAGKLKSELKRRTDTFQSAIARAENYGFLRMMRCLIRRLASCVSQFVVYPLWAFLRWIILRFPAYSLWKAGHWFAKAAWKLKYQIARLISLPIAVFALFGAFVAVYSLIPVRFGGGGPEPVTLWVERSSLPLFDACDSDEQKKICASSKPSDWVKNKDFAVLHENSDYVYLLNGVTNKVLVISKDIIKRRE